MSLRRVLTGVTVLSAMALGAVGLAPVPAPVPAIAEAAAVPPPPVTPISGMSMVPLKTWGVSGLNVAETQTPSLDVLVWDMIQLGDRMFVVGGFQNVQESREATPIPQPFIAAFDVNTGVWVESWRPKLDRAAYTVEIYNGKLIVGGEFENVNGTPRKGLVAIDPRTGAIDTSFTGAVDRPWSTARALVRDLAVDADNLYVVGNFSHLSGEGGARTQVYKAGRFTSAAGTVDGTWKPRVTGSSVWGVAVDHGRSQVNFAGFFTGVNGLVGSGYFHTVDITTGASVPGMKAIPRNLPTAQPEFYDVEVGTDTVWAAGEQHMLQVLAPSDHTMLGYHHTGYANPGFAYTTAFAGGAYQVGAKIGNIIFAGCHCTVSERLGKLNHFSSYTGKFTPHRLLMAYDATTGQLIEDFMPDINSPRDGTWAVTTDTNGCLYMGGDFHVGGLDHGTPHWLGGFGKFCAKDFDPNAQPGGNGNSLLPAGSTWTYSDAGTEPDAGWRSAGFAATGWKQGAAALGFNNGEKTTMTTGRTTYYARSTFNVAGTKPAALEVKLRADDGAVVYLNGTEVVRDNMPEGTITAATTASTWRAEGDEGFRSFTVPGSALVAGTNVVAVEVHNVWSGNNDLVFDLEIAPSTAAVPPGPLVALGSTWNYADPANGEPATFKQGLPDTRQGPAQFGFGEGDERTPVPSGYISYYFTKKFQVADPTLRTSLTLSLVADDGAVVYLNGTELTRVNMPDGAIGPDTRPLTYLDGPDEALKVYQVPAKALIKGTNVLAVEVHNLYRSNKDLSFDASLE